MIPNYLTLAEAAKELSKQLERQVTERQVLAYGENNQISIFSKINRDARFVRVNPIEGEQNEFQAVNGSLPRLSSNAVTSLLLTGHAEYKEHTNYENVNFFGHVERTLVVTYKIADGETPPETTIADCRISQASIDKIVDDELLVAVLEWEGKTTNYNYWLKLAILTPREAIMLLNFCHPQRPLNTFSKVDAAKREHYEKLENELTQAERAQTAGIVPANASPQDWLNWANANNINVPTQFNAILCKPPIELEQPNASQPDNNIPLPNKPITNRLTRLYSEIAEIENYKIIGKQKIITYLKENINKAGTCVISVEGTNIYWRDYQSNKQTTTFDNLSTWLRRKIKA